MVSDNLRAGITKACFHEAAVTRTYAEMAAHYNTVGAAPVAARGGLGAHHGAHDRGLPPSPLRVSGDDLCAFVQLRASGLSAMPGPGLASL